MKLLGGQLGAQVGVMKQNALAVEGPGAVLQPDKDEHIGDHGCHKGGEEGRGGSGAQVGHGDDVLNGGGAGAVHGPGPAAGRDGGGDEPPGDVGGLEHLKGNGVNYEEHHKAADAAVSKDAGDGHDDGGHIFAVAEADQGFGDGFGSAGELVYRAEQRAHEEHQKVVGYIGGGSGHKGSFQAFQNGQAEADQHEHRDNGGQDQSAQLFECQHAEEHQGQQ
ncbi:hypothetical protein SDC9_122371 [bioreactor metagenome]|uniref:Uncharacterized protein n=1 Tax=bioreactor metagenome TaxID=1076179 RepID=A0A645CEI2_9ZZZZ